MTTAQHGCRPKLDHYTWDQISLKASRSRRRDWQPLVTAQAAISTVSPRPIPNIQYPAAWPQGDRRVRQERDSGTAAKAGVKLVATHDVPSATSLFIISKIQQMTIFVLNRPPRPTDRPTDPGMCGSHAKHRFVRQFSSVRISRSPQISLFALARTRDTRNSRRTAHHARL